VAHDQRGEVTIRTQFYAQLREAAALSSLDVELTEGATVQELLDQVYATIPALRSHDKTILVGAGLEFVDRSYRLRPGQEIAIMPPVQGG
jgi:molybdopterin converting factor small subunit